MGDDGCLHVGTQRALRRAHARARSSGAGAGEAGSGRRQREGDTELCCLSFAPVQQGEVARCQVEEAMQRWCTRQRWRGVDAFVPALFGRWCPSGAGQDSLAEVTTQHQLSAARAPVLT
jgi:hypothetical protein